MFEAEFSGISFGSRRQFIHKGFIGKTVLDTTRATQVRRAKYRLLDMLGGDLDIRERVGCSRVLKEKADPVTRAGITRLGGGEQRKIQRLKRRNVV